MKRCRVFSRAGVSQAPKLGRMEFWACAVLVSAVKFFLIFRVCGEAILGTLKIWERERDDFQDFMAPGLLCEQKKPKVINMHLDRGFS